jgi:ketosteroid isomerase-like protein
MSGAEEAAIRALIATYGAAFDDADSEAVTALFAWPATIRQFGESHVFASAEDLAKNVEALIDVFDEAGIVINSPEVTEVRLSGATASATALWRQLDGAGHLLNEFTCRYLLVRGEDAAWRITAVVNEAEPDSAFDLPR